jgi:hypothetical protein
VSLGVVAAVEMLLRTCRVAGLQLLVAAAALRMQGGSNTGWACMRVVVWC